MADGGHNSRSSTHCALDVATLPLSEGDIYIFDFDGVVINDLEDAIYHLRVANIENEIFENIRNSERVHVIEYPNKYLRHLIYQEVALHANTRMEPGPAFGVAKWASDNAAFYVLTARSSWAAIERLRHFMEEHDCLPIEMFCVGRTSKEPQLRLLLDEAGDRNVHYIEDSVRHIEIALQIDDPRLRVYQAPKPIHSTRKLRDLSNKKIKGFDYDKGIRRKSG